MNFKANYEIIEFSTGANIIPTSGGTAVHQVYCISGGSATVIAQGGGTATFAMSANEKVDVLTRSVNVVSGTFIGFKSKNTNV